MAKTKDENKRDGNPFKYTFRIDGDVFGGVSYERYLASARLKDAVNDRNRLKLVLGRKILVMRQDYLKAHSDARDEFELLKKDYKLNRLKYFAPNSKSQEDFINYWGSADVVAMVAPNRVGKTTCGVVKMLLSGMLKTDPEWPVFKEHGIEWKPFRGDMEQLQVGMGTYEWSHVKSVLWPRVREWLPDSELGIYSVGEAERKRRSRKDPNFERIPVMELLCGTQLKMHAYSQGQITYESAAYDDFLYDEQPNEEIFHGIDERLRTRRGRHYFALTPHRVDGMPHTGGGGFLQKLLTGEQAMGHEVKVWNTSVMDVPDWVYPESEKKKAMEKWIHEPSRHRNVKMLREGKARMFGEWHTTSGIVLDEWDRTQHIIDDFQIPDDWTRYRALDHGITNPTVCLWLAVSPPDGNFGSKVIVYREYYSQGKLIGENVAKVIEMSGNVRQRYGYCNNDDAGFSIAMHREVVKREWYAKTVLDSRSFAGTDTHTGKPHGHLYKMAGLPVQPSCGKQSAHWLPILKEALFVNYGLKHQYNVGIDGMPHLLVFRSCTNLIREIEGWKWDEHRSGGWAKNPKETPMKKDDHGCTALGYAAMIPLRWRGDIYRPQNGEQSSDIIEQRTEQDFDNGYRSV